MIYPQSTYTPKPLRTDQAAQRLQDRLLHYFHTVCPERHDIQIPVDSPEDLGPEDADCVLRFDVPGLRSMEARFTIHHVGGNVFEVSGELDGRPPERFSSCCITSASKNDLASFEDTIGEFLLTELKCVVGTYVLRHSKQFEAIPA